MYSQAAAVRIEDSTIDQITGGKLTKLKKTMSRGGWTIEELAEVMNKYEFCGASIVELECDRYVRYAYQQLEMAFYEATKSSLRLRYHYGDGTGFDEADGPYWCFEKE